jgi:threonine/homoserine/homoserine lactone efflux protein
VGRGGSRRLRVATVPCSVLSPQSSVFARRVGIGSGLGSACGIAVYGGVAGFGLTAISDGLLRQQRWLSLVGGLCLLYIGYTIVRSEPATEVATDTERSLAGAFSSTFFLTLISPAVVLYFLAIFAGAGLVGPGGDYVAAALLVVGVFAGSALWWVGLSTLVALLRSRLNRRLLQWANWLSGLAIAGFGVVVLLRAGLAP